MSHETVGPYLYHKHICVPEMQTYLGAWPVRNPAPPVTVDAVNYPLNLPSPLLRGPAFSYCRDRKAEHPLSQTAVCLEAKWVPLFRFAHGEAQASFFGACLWTSKVMETRGFVAAMWVSVLSFWVLVAWSWEGWPDSWRGPATSSWTRSGRGCLLIMAASARGSISLNTLPGQVSVVGF